MHYPKLTLPAQCLYQGAIDPSIVFEPAPPNTPSTQIAKAEDFFESACNNISSCLEWRQLLRDVLELGSSADTKLPSGITVNLAEPPPSRQTTPLTPPPPTPPESPRHTSPISRAAGHHLDHSGPPSRPANKRLYVGMAPPQASSSRRRGRSRDSNDEHFRQGECMPFAFLT